MDTWLGTCSVVVTRVTVPFAVSPIAIATLLLFGYRLLFGCRFRLDIAMERVPYMVSKLFSDAFSWIGIGERSELLNGTFDKTFFAKPTFDVGVSGSNGSFPMSM